MSPSAYFLTLLLTFPFEDTCLSKRAALGGVIAARRMARHLTARKQWAGLFLFPDEFVGSEQADQSGCQRQCQIAERSQAMISSIFA